MERKVAAFISVICLLAGVIIGLLCAPARKRIFFGRSGENTRYSGAWDYDDEEEDEIPL